jgi:hypothetical protein
LESLYTTFTEFLRLSLSLSAVTTKDDADKTAQDSYSKILGRVYPSIAFQPHPRAAGFRNCQNTVENESRDGNPVEADKAPSTSESIVTAQDEQGSFLSKQINAVRKFTSAALQSVFQKDVRLWTNKSPFNMCFFEFVHLLLARYMMCVGCV